MILPDGKVGWAAIKPSELMINRFYLGQYIGDEDCTAVCKTIENSTLHSSYVCSRSRTCATAPPCQASRIWRFKLWGPFWPSFQPYLPVLTSVSSTRFNTPLFYTLSSHVRVCFYFWPQWWVECRILYRFANGCNSEWYDSRRGAELSWDKKTRFGQKMATLRLSVW